MLNRDLIVLEKNIIYLSSELGDSNKINKLLKGDCFAANNLEEAIIHEFAHKKHRQAIKALYENSKKGIIILEKQKRILIDLLGSLLIDS